ncbi:MAG: hypothetical protein LBL30_00675 [Holosporales bacterium]|jgi:hypothetical protein|nr:hypothetical protein [Holosporales bacterium]
MKRVSYTTWLKTAAAIALAFTVEDGMSAAPRDVNLVSVEQVRDAQNKPKGKKYDRFGLSWLGATSTSEKDERGMLIGSDISIRVTPSNDRMTFLDDRQSRDLKLQGGSIVSKLIFPVGPHISTSIGADTEFVRLDTADPQINSLHSRNRLRYGPNVGVGLSFGPWTVKASYSRMFPFKKGDGLPSPDRNLRRGENKFGLSVLMGF